MPNEEEYEPTEEEKAHIGYCYNLGQEAFDRVAKVFGIKEAETRFRALLVRFNEKVDQKEVEKYRRDLLYLGVGSLLFDDRNRFEILMAPPKPKISRN